jgi:hypothetical protein
VRPKQAFEDYRKLHTSAGIGWAELLLYGNTKDVSKHSKLLVYGSRLEEAGLDDAALAVDSLVRFEPLAQMDLDLRRADLGHLHCSENWPQSLERGFVCLVSFLGSNRRLGVVGQEKICPFPKSKVLALAQGIQRIIVSGLKPLT